MPTGYRPTQAQAFGAGQVRAFGQRVRAARERIGWSQEKLAFVCGFHRTYAGNVERGAVNPSLYNILRLATGLGVDPAELVAGLGPVEMPPSPLVRWMTDEKEADQA
jgi:transcriptional regulator with XRE-family HTH domain